MPDKRLDWLWEKFAQAATAAMNFVLWVAGGFRK